jgi:hypothetical protein
MQFLVEPSSQSTYQPEQQTVTDDPLKLDVDVNSGIDSTDTSDEHGSLATTSLAAAAPAITPPLEKSTVRTSKVSQKHGGTIGKWATPEYLNDLVKHVGKPWNRVAKAIRRPLSSVYNHWKKVSDAFLKENGEIREKPLVPYIVDRDAVQQAWLRNEQRKAAPHGKTDREFITLLIEYFNKDGDPWEAIAQHHLNTTRKAAYQRWHDICSACLDSTGNIRLRIQGSYDVDVVAVKNIFLLSRAARNQKKWATPKYLEKLVSVIHKPWSTVLKTLGTSQSTIRRRWTQVYEAFLDDYGSLLPKPKEEFPIDAKKVQAAWLKLYGGGRTVADSK